MTESGRLVLRSSASKDTTPETGVMLGRALAMDYRRVVVARDYMRSSTMMKDALVAGLISSGADVVDIGYVSFPVAGMFASRGDCAVYVTEYREFGRFSGYVLMNSDGGLFRIDQVRHLDRVFDEPPMIPERLGRVMSEANSVEVYNRKLLSLMEHDAECGIVLDCNCGSSALSAPQILNAMGADLASMNAQFDRDYTVHSLIPADSDLRDLRQFIGSDPGTVGIALNRIGNLMTVLDEKGNVIPDETVLAMMILMMRPKTLVVPMDISSLVEDAFYGRLDIDMKLRGEAPEESELKLVRTVPNAGILCDEMRANGAELGYYKGGFIFSDISMAPDAIHASCMIAQIAAANSLVALTSSFPAYYRDTASYRLLCSKDDFHRLMDERIGGLGHPYMSNRHGWRVDMEDGWFLVRINTENEDRVEVLAESRDRAYLAGMAEVAAELVESCSKGQRIISSSSGSPRESYALQLVLS